MPTDFLIQLCDDHTSIACDTLQFNKPMPYNLSILSDNDADNVALFSTILLLHHVFDIACDQPGVIISCQCENQSTRIAPGVAQFITGMMQKTLRCMQSIQRKSIDNKKWLFVNVNDNARYKALADELKQRAADCMIYHNIQDGWDVTARKYTHAGSHTTVDTMLSWIQNDQITDIVSFNSYVCMQYLKKEGVFLPAILKAAHVNVHQFDNDVYDSFELGTLQKRTFHYGHMHRYIVPWVYEKDINHKLDLSPISSAVLPNAYDRPMSASTFQLRKITDVLVFSHSRIQMVKQMLPLIVDVLSMLGEDDVLRRIMLWYLSLKQLVLEQMDIHSSESAVLLSRLYRLFYATCHFLKYVMIHSIGSADVKIYGDDGWQSIFPDQYQNAYLSKAQMSEVLDHPTVMRMIVSQSFHYFDGGPISDAISDAGMFISYPTLTYLDELSPLKQMEIDSPMHIDSLLQSLPDIAMQTDFQKAFSRLNNYYLCDMNATIERVYTGQSSYEGEIVNATLDQQLVAHVSDFLTHHGSILQKSVQLIAHPETCGVDISKSPYANAPFLKALCC